MRADPAVRLRRLLAAVALLAVAGCTVTPGADTGMAGDDVTTTVERIVDGDTIHLADLDERLRLIGIDTPETRHPEVGVECFGREASAHLERLVPPGTEVRVEWDVERADRHGRPLGYLHRVSDDVFVNLRMVADGYAVVLTVPPNVAHQDELRAAERGARDAGRGLWSACGGADTPAGASAETPDDE